MNTHQRSGCWYIDVRPDDSTEQVSLDLTQHLPRRLGVGKSLVVCDEPRRLVPVIRKRWMVLLSIVEKQLASTLDRFKKEGLERETRHMRTFLFSRKIPNEDPEAAVFFLTPTELNAPLTDFKTIYILSRLSKTDFALTVSHLLEGGLIVLYGNWHADYEEVMYDLVRSHKNLPSMQNYRVG